jgi:Bacteriophage HK97-gp10, putative tail-component
MSEIKIFLEGKDKLIAQLQRLTDAQYIPALSAALFQEGEALIAEAKLITPVDTGALRASGHVLAPEVRGKTVTVQCGFGGPAAGYAVYVHEDLTKNHPVGQAKFLEEPAKRRASGMNERVAQRIAQSVR